MKKILVIYFSQSGQLLGIIKSVLSSLEQDDRYAITYEELKPVPSFPFPWSYLNFFDVHPESVLEIPTELDTFQFDANENYDLVIIGYQTWFLSPSIPITSFFATSEAEKVLKNTPVVTINGCRNMWIQSQEQIKLQLKRLSANLILNIPLYDRNNNITSVFTIPVWMASGKKSFFKFLPAAGVSQVDIDDAAKFGPILHDYLEADPKTKKQNLSEKYPAEVNEKLILLEQNGKRIFKKWAKIIRLFGNPRSTTRKPVLLLFSIYLITAIILLFPINFLIFGLYKLLFKKKLNKRLEYFSKNVQN